MREGSGESGLGLEAQRQAVEQFIAGAPLLAEFQSAKNHRNRPYLLAAVELCSRKRARLVIARLDRLARNVHFISGLTETKVELVSVDNFYQLMKERQTGGEVTADPNQG